MNSLSSTRTEARCLVEAAAWRTRLSENDLDTTPEFEAWLAADCRNRSAWDRVQEPWNFVGQQAASPELLELRRATLSNAREAARGRWTVPRVRFLPPAGRGRRILAAAAVAAFAALGLVTWDIYSPDVYRTQTGERRVVTLSDGSQVQLDSSTELRVRYSAHARQLALSRGQARFDVAHDVERPFSVTAGKQKVVATGTAFNVDMLGSNVLVTLIEGHVVVLPENAAANTGNSPEQLDAGQQLVVSASGSSNIMPANIERATAWQNGQLVFDNEPLISVVERVNRYAPRLLVLEDDRVADLRISGVFNTDDIEGFVDTLTRYLPVDADKRDRSIRLSHR